MAEGYIKLHRSLLEWEWYSDDRAKVLFLHLLLTCNWKEGKWRGEVIAPGSAAISLSRIAAELGWERSVVKRTLDKLVSSGEVERKANAKWTLVTLVNWAKYQDQGTQTEHKVERRPNADRTQSVSQPHTIEEGKKKEVRRTAIAVPRATTPDEFKAQCAAVAAEHPDLLPPSLRKAFFDYWTERDAQGRMRLQAEKHFEIPRRMTTWRANAEKRGEIPVPAPERKTGWLTPDGK